MAMSKVTFTIPDEVATSLNERVPYGRRSAFVAAAIRDRLRRMHEDERSRELKEGYSARREEDVAINAEWEAATLESWPE